MTNNNIKSTNNLNRIPSWVIATVIALSGLAISASAILTSDCSTIHIVVKFVGVEYRLEKEGCRNQTEQYQLPQPSTTSHIDSDNNSLLNKKQ